MIVVKVVLVIVVKVVLVIVVMVWQEEGGNLDHDCGDYGYGGDGLDHDSDGCSGGGVADGDLDDEKLYSTECE